VHHKKKKNISAVAEIGLKRIREEQRLWTTIKKKLKKGEKKKWVKKRPY